MGYWNKREVGKLEVGQPKVGISVVQKDSWKEWEVGEILDGKFGMKWEKMKLES